MDNNEDVARATQSVLRAEALFRTVRAAVLPSAEAAAAETVLDEEPGFDDVVVQPRRQLSVTATLSVPLLAASRWARRTQAADRIEVARLRAADVRKEIREAAAQAYLAVIAARRQVQVDERARGTRPGSSATTRKRASKRAPAAAWTRCGRLSCCPRPRPRWSGLAWR